MKQAKPKLLTIKARHDNQPGWLICFSCWETHLDAKLGYLGRLGYEIVEVVGRSSAPSGQGAWSG